MIKIALTGGIGSGKSYLSRHFIEMGIPVFYSDIEAKKLYKNRDVLTRLKKEFPNKDIWNKDGSLSKNKLKKMFNDKKFIKQLVLLLQTYILAKFDVWAAKQKTPCVIMESAIIYEYGFEKYFDKVIVANASKELRIKRIKERNPKMSEKDIEQRMSCQMSQEEKCKRADLVICTGETYEEELKFLS